MDSEVFILGRIWIAAEDLASPSVLNALT